MNGHRRRVIALTTAGVLLAAGLAGGGWWLGRDDQGRPTASGGASAPTVNPGTLAKPSAPTTEPMPTPTPAGTWKTLPPAPIPGGGFDTDGLWTGRELLIVGGANGKGVGAAYNPATNSWRRLPPTPGPAESIEGGYMAVWTGRELLGGGLGLDAAYDPATNRWRSLGEWRGNRNGVGVWTGRQVLTWGGGCCDDYSAGGSAYSPETDTWERLPQAPLAGRHTTGAWTGSELIVAGGTGRSANGGAVEYQAFADAAAYNPSTRTWRRLPPMPEPRAGATTTWTGSEVLVVGGSGPSSNVRPYVRLYTDAVAYNPASNRWRRLPVMGDTGRTDHSATWTGRQLLVWGGRTLREGSWTTPRHGVAYDPASNRWSAMPKSVLRGRTNHVAVWTGSQLLVWGGHAVKGGPIDDGAAYTPQPL
jgi:N-acetylneuraminic acid mutarotase